MLEFLDFEALKSRVFIAKPEASCQGKGIVLITKCSDLPKKGKFVVQEYLNT